MTGFGLISQDLGNVKYTVEIKSLNSKFLELSVKLPRVFADKEFELRNECSRSIERGKVNLSFNIEQNEAKSAALGIDVNLLQQYLEQLKEVSVKTAQPANNLLQLALGLPDVMKYQEEKASEDEWKTVAQLFKKAVDSFQQFRLDEGNVLENDMKLRIGIILENLEKVAVEEPVRIITIKDRLNNFLAEAVGKENIDQNRFEQELIYYIDKLDITEEKIRLKTHCDYFLETLKSADANGKKLGFIAQEIGREVNTLGSKANNAAIQKLVVGMKEELEKIKEQLLNVL
ncbi:MAG: YicC family protein [Sphingobacteriaceae bacterium]|nr:MAG: YicC family protein [Sphingobacteriaceae bacterium]